MNMLNAALLWADNGFEIIPCFGKRPIIKNWNETASSDPTTIEKWYKQFPNANIGVKCGDTIFDLDIEKKGLEVFKKLQQLGSLPNTVLIRTGGGGLRYLFKQPTFNKITSTKLDSIGYPHIEIRGKGAQVIVPPSIHPDTKECYFFINEFTNLDDIAKPPQWLIDLIYKAKNNTNNITNQSKYVYAVISENQIIKDGSRNLSVFDTARWMRDQGIDQKTAYSKIKIISQSQFNPPYKTHTEQIELLNTVKSAYSKEWKIKDNYISNENNIVPDFNYDDCLSQDAIPVSLWDWTKEISERKNVYHEMVLIPSFVAIAGICNAKFEVQIKQKDKWSTNLNLWGMLVAPPSSKKSPVLADLTYVLKKIQEDESVKFVQDQNKFYAIEKRINKEISQLEKKFGDGSASNDYIELQIREKKEELDRSKPKEKVVISYDTTIQKLAQTLSENSYGTFCFNDELPELFDSFNQKGKETDRVFYNKLWDGKQANVVRRKTSENIYVPKTCVSIFGGIPTAKLRPIMEMAVNGNGDGFFQRFQIVMPYYRTREYAYVDIEPNASLFNLINNIFLKIYNHPNKETFKFDINGQEVYKLYEQWLYEEARKCKDLNNEGLEGYIIKCNTLMPKIAGLIHLWQWGELDINLDLTISEIEALMAAKVAKRIIEYGVFSYSIKNQLTRDS